MKLLIVTDAWYPQVNGVVRTFEQVRTGLIRQGWRVKVLGPDGWTLPCPTYAEIRLSLQPTALLQEAMLSFQPQAVHIATEGPLGLAARQFCLSRELPFTTSFHTRFPEYLKLRFGMPRRWVYSYLRRFHEPARRTLAPSSSIQKELFTRGFQNVEVWGRGVETDLFHPDKREALPFPGPIQLYVGRLAVEKNIEAFLKLSTPGTKVVVGDGPDRARLQALYPQTVFTGPQFGEALARLYASADVFVFPSFTDTFGLVLLEALASGVPVAAFRSPGPLDVITSDKVGVLAETDGLAPAIEKALELKREDCRALALQHSWQRSVERFSHALAPFGSIWENHRFIPCLKEVSL